MSNVAIVFPGANERGSLVDGKKSHVLKLMMGVICMKCCTIDENGPWCQSEVHKNSLVVLISSGGNGFFKMFHPGDMSISVVHVEQFSLD